MACASARSDSASSEPVQPPMPHMPYPVSETCQPVRPNRRVRTWKLCLAGAHRREEVLVGLRLRHLRQEQLHRLDWREGSQHLAEHPDTVEILFRNQELFLA